MNHYVTTLFKALGVLALSAFIFFLYLPKEQVQERAVNLALEFLGKRLLAMVPKEQEREFETRFEAVREQALKGEISDEHLQDFSTIVLNAEAEGESLALAKIDSALLVLHQNEDARRVDETRRMQEERHLEQWAQRMQEFEQFEKRWQTLVPDSTVKHVQGRRRNRPLYRISKNFVVQIDSAALSQAIAIAIAPGLDSLPALPGHMPPPPQVSSFVRQLEGDLRDLRVEWHAGEFERKWHWADSVRARAKAKAHGPKGVEVISPEFPTPPQPEASSTPRKN